MPRRPDTPGKHGKPDRERCGEEPRPASRPGDDERRGEHARREQDSLALGVGATREQHCGRGEPPARRVAEPQGEQKCCDRDEDVQEDVALRGQQTLAEARHDQDEQKRRPQEPGRRPAMEQSSSGTDGADDHEPELHVQRDDVRSPHRVEGGGVEYGLERRI